MTLLPLYKGLILGFSVAAPVGPIGVLCINRTIHKGFRSGLGTGLGAATADLVYGIIAGLGITIISDFLLEQKKWLQLAGLVFLFYLGIKTLLKKREDFTPGTVAQKGYFRDYVSTFFLTITNPVTILFFLALFAGMGLAPEDGSRIAALPLVMGVFLGSAFWWLTLSGLTHFMRGRFSVRLLRWIDVVSGVMILGFGAALLVGLLRG